MQWYDSVILGEHQSLPYLFDSQFLILIRQMERMLGASTIQNMRLQINVYIKDGQRKLLLNNIFRFQPLNGRFYRTWFLLLILMN